MAPVSRRTLLVGAGAGAGLVLAFSLWPRSRGSALQAGRDPDRLFGSFLKVGTDGRVTVAVPQVEMGQGSWTALPQILADELGADWASVAVEPAPLAGDYPNPLAGRLGGFDPGDPRLRLTAGSTSVRAFEAPLRHAGATARAMLCAAAARRWKVAADECDSAGGFVRHEGKRLAFAALADAAARERVPDEPPLRAPSTRRLAGQPLPRLDLPAKSDGSFRLAADVRLPGLLQASARLAPPGCRLLGHDAAAARRVPGLRALVATNGWLAAVADQWWVAEQALAAANPRFSGRRDGDETAVGRALDAALGAATPFHVSGDYDQAVAGSRPLAATYEVAARSPERLEPDSATARFSADGLELWVATQAPALARAAAAAAAGLGQREVVLYPLAVGGVGGGAVESLAAPLAIALAGRLKAPVQLTPPWAETVNHRPLAAPLRARMAALPQPGGSRIAAWSATIATADGLADELAALLGRKFGTLGEDALATAIPPYAIPALRIAAGRADLPLRTGSVRGEQLAAAAFATESFVDEMARAGGAEPLSYRVAMLGTNLRLAEALLAAARIGGWDGGGAGSTMGLAAVSAYGSHIGLLASATIGEDRTVRVDRLVAAVDCGRVINPGLVRQQIEGGLVSALQQATRPTPRLVAGMPVAADPGGLRLDRLPRIEIELVPSDAAPGGVSGLGLLPLAPAVANALAAQGRRLRKLPFALI
ncbi:xanthine dehydrogenase family protein molybdopterin-binding subunit [Sphingomonas ginkgonis]|uniref:Xanthine dehydrogenase family protein molybdopterin-binding subunit n=1 Tax=Sphingomonas ginkgonis TaxID=2315330 RepID=A0A3R9Y826_9SPHN|nr:xanthine dehydrogenase family protein molybdopterin-binding subunit [Sphingomonas ginkgonis]